MAIFTKMNYNVQYEVSRLLIIQSKRMKKLMKKQQRWFTNVLFLVYLILLAWIILMKTEFSFDHIYRVRSTNFIPFEGTAVYNNQLHYQEIYLNVLIFVPFGIYLSVLKPSWHFLQKAILIFLVSFSFESLQYIYAIGVTDITDLLGNTLGGIIGILFYLIIQKVFKCRIRTNRFMNFFASLGTISFVLGYGLLLLINH